MLRFLRTLTGQIILMVVLAGLVGWTLYSTHQRRSAAADVPPAAPESRNINPLLTTSATDSTRPPAAPAGAPSTSIQLQTGQAITRLIVPETRIDDYEAAPPTIPKEIRAQMLAEPTPLTLFATDYTPPPAPREQAPFAPYGRMIRCKLVTGLESSNLATPLVAIVTEDLWHRGPDGIPQLIIPAGVEVHGPPASRGRIRDRLEANGPYVFVWRTTDNATNGRELTVSGMALTRAVDPVSGTVLPADGSGGIKGDLLDTVAYSELKLFAASFLKAAAAAGYQASAFTNPLTNEQNASVMPSVRNAGVAGVQAVLDEFADKMRKQIEQDGYYVAVPAGREFYVYVPQTIDLGQARRGPFAAISNTSANANATP